MSEEQLKEARLYFESDEHISCQRQIKYLQNQLEQKQAIINEAREYIENNLQYRTTKWSRHYLLKILKGSDKK